MCIFIIVVCCCYYLHFETQEVAYRSTTNKEPPALELGRPEPLTHCKARLQSNPSRDLELERSIGGEESARRPTLDRVEGSCLLCIYLSIPMWFA